MEGEIVPMPREELEPYSLVVEAAESRHAIR